MPRTASSNSLSIWPSPTRNWKSSALPPWKVSPSILPSKSTVTRSPSCGGGVLRALGEGAALLAQDVQRLVDGGVGHFGAELLDFGVGQVADLHFRDTPRTPRRKPARLRATASFSVILGWPATRSLASLAACGEGLADLVVHHLVVHRVAVALGHDVHRHLAGTEAVHLDGARQLLQAGIDFGLDDVDGQRQRDLAFQLFEGFNGHGHDVVSLAVNRVLVRGGGLEPPHHCWRQDLNLVRLPISPPARSLKSDTGGPVTRTARSKSGQPRILA